MLRAVLPAAVPPADKPAGSMPEDVDMCCQTRPVWQDPCCLQEEGLLVDLAPHLEALHRTCCTRQTHCALCGLEHGQKLADLLTLGLCTGSAADDGSAELCAVLQEERLLADLLAQQATDAADPVSSAEDLQRQLQGRAVELQRAQKAAEEAGRATADWQQHSEELQLRLQEQQGHHLEEVQRCRGEVQQMREHLEVGHWSSSFLVLQRLR